MCGQSCYDHIMFTGELAPDLTLLRPDGSSAQLREFHNREFLLLLFLRHLA